jgi:GNAT superfamily N-acetyltransferase
VSPTRSLSWVREDHPVWDADKQRVIGGAPEGAFVLPFHEGDDLPGEWWSARDGDTVVGYGRLDIGWGGDAEILLAVDPERQEQGVGSFVLAGLEAEASTRGINYVYNTIREHAARDLVHDWLVVRGFRGPVDGDLRKRVRPAAEHAAPGSTATRPEPPPASGAAAYDPRDDGDRGPGHEESGGYVDVDEHRY